MRMTGNTMLITGGGSGIGRGLAEAFHGLGNRVVIAGRTLEKLEAVAQANPGMEAVRLDVGDAAAVKAFASTARERWPGLDVVINNAGMMAVEDLKTDAVGVAEATVGVNLLGTIRLTAALMPQLLGQAHAAVITVTSGLGFVPMAMNPAYSASKAAVHAWTVALRHQLRDTAVEVVELIPPYVQTTLNGAYQAEDPEAMPLADYVAEVMQILGDEPGVEEVVVARCRFLRDAAAEGRFDTAFAAVQALGERRREAMG